MNLSRVTKKRIAEILGYEKFTKECNTKFLNVPFDKFFELICKHDYKIKIDFVEKK